MVLRSPSENADEVALCRLPRPFRALEHLTVRLLSDAYGVRAVVGISLGGGCGPVAFLVLVAAAAGARVVAADTGEALLVFGDE